MSLRATNESEAIQNFLDRHARLRLSRDDGYMKGLFITFEGVEGCGKSTQLKLLHDHLKMLGIDPILTREPGGTEIGDQIRQILLKPQNCKMTPICELLLYSASRHQHIREKIAPAIKSGRLVICDRFSDATAAYQGAARLLPESLIDAMQMIATEGTMPDLTFLFDLPVEQGLERIRMRDKVQDRLETEKIDFHERVRAGYLSLAKKDSSRIKVIDASRTIDQIKGEIFKITEALLKRFGYVE